MVEETRETFHATAIIEVNGEPFFNFLDTEAGNSFVSYTFINHMNQQILHKTLKALETIQQLLLRNYQYSTSTSQGGENCTDNT